MLCGDMTYGQARSASCFGGDWTYGRDAKSRERIHYVDPKRLRALHQGANRICTRQQKPVEIAQVAKRLVQRGKIIRRVKRDHGLEYGFGAARLEFANECLRLIGRTSNENTSAGERGCGGFNHAEP